MNMTRMFRNLWLALLFGAVGCSAGTPQSGLATTQQAPTAQNSPADPLSAAGQAQLKAILDKSRLDNLQWPNFSDYSPQIKEFYQKGGYALEWTRDGKPTQQATQVIAIFEQAANKGLDAKDYDGERWPARLNALTSASSKDESGLVNFDVAMTVSAMRYASDLHLGKVDPRTLHTDFEPERNEYDLCDFLLLRIVPATNVSDAFSRIEPPYPGYQRELLALQKYMQLAQAEKLDPLPTVSKPISPGKPYPAVPQLVARLKFLGDLPETATVGADPSLYEGDAVDGVKHFQERHGLDIQGQLGAQTIAELNRPMSDRVTQIRLTLERWRWLPHNFDQPPIVVNIPEFALRAYDNQREVALRMRVVVGRAMRTQTPVMEEEMKYVIFWPYWNVPPSILRNEIVPKITKDRAYIQKNNFEVATYQGQVVTDGVISDDVLAQLRAGKLMVRQKPGPKNALGLIKFIFPNDNNVYLHSTPSQQLFAQSRRDFSHGCVRVEDPAKLAEYVLRNNPGWDRQRIDAAFKAEKEQQVNLPKPIPVLIVYGTAIAPEDGHVHFYDDIYGYDKRLSNLFYQAYASQNNSNPPASVGAQASSPASKGD
jgi:murein L,D-transpeptidase YcbB/YkuD